MIPTEIVDHILSVLHSDQDYTALETCSTVFPQIVHRHLYSQITLFLVDEALGDSTPVLPSRSPFYHRIEPTYYLVDPTKFYRRLIEHPHVANYVRVIQIIIKVKLAPPNGFQRLGLGDQVSVTSSILSILPHLESVVVSAPIRQVSWRTLGSEFYTAFGNCVRLPSIKSVAISNMEDFSLHHFDDCKNLRNLVLDGLFIHGKTISTSPYPRLHSLHVDSHPDMTRTVSWMKSNTLHTLSFRLHSGHSLPDLRTLIEACSTTLLNLDVNHNYNYLRFPSTHYVFPDLRLPLLDHFIFWCPIEGSAFRNVSPLILLVPFLGSIKTLSPIRLTLHLLLFTFLTDWSLVTPVLVLPIFRHPIELYFIYDRKSMEFLDIVYLLEQNSDIKKLLEERKVVVINDEE